MFFWFIPYALFNNNPNDLFNFILIGNGVGAGGDPFRQPLIMRGIIPLGKSPNKENSVNKGERSFMVDRKHSIVKLSFLLTIIISDRQADRRKQWDSVFQCPTNCTAHKKYTTYCR